jgi:hypothetical protein
MANVGEDRCGCSPPVRLAVFPGGPGKTWSPDDFVSLMNDLEEWVFGTLPDETWVYPVTRTTRPWAANARR